MEAKGAIRAADELGLLASKLLQAPAAFSRLQAGLARGEIEVFKAMPRLRALQLRIKACQWRGQARREQREALHRSAPR